MTQEEKELLLKDLCSRLPYECIVSVAEGGIDGIQWTDATLNSYLLHQIMEEEAWEYVKPYLRPISSMTEEEKKEYIEYADYEIEESVNGRHYEYYLKDLCGTPNNPSVNADSVDWLNKNMFDYRGLIPKDLALEAKEGMYIKTYKN